MPRSHYLYRKGYIGRHCHGESALVVGAVAVNGHHILGAHVHGGYHGSCHRVVLGVENRAGHDVARRGRFEDTDVHGSHRLDSRCGPFVLPLVVSGCQAIIEPRSGDLHLELGTHRQRNLEYTIGIGHGSSQRLRSTPAGDHRQGNRHRIHYRPVAVVVHLAGNQNGFLPLEDADVQAAG